MNSRLGSHVKVVAILTSLCLRRIKDVRVQHIIVCLRFLACGPMLQQTTSFNLAVGRRIHETLRWCLAALPEHAIVGGQTRSQTYI